MALLGWFWFDVFSVLVDIMICAKCGEAIPEHTLYIRNKKGEVFHPVCAGYKALV